jgi:hypothetical protein
MPSRTPTIHLYSMVEDVPKEDLSDDEDDTEE